MNEHREKNPCEDYTPDTYGDCYWCGYPMIDHDMGDTPPDDFEEDLYNPYRGDR